MPVSLANLLRIGQPKEHPADAEEIARLLSAAERGIADDARIERAHDVLHGDRRRLACFDRGPDERLLERARNAFGITR